MDLSLIQQNFHTHLQSLLNIVHWEAVDVEKQNTADVIVEDLEWEAKNYADEEGDLDLRNYKPHNETWDYDKEYDNLWTEVQHHGEELLWNYHNKAELLLEFKRIKSEGNLHEYIEDLYKYKLKLLQEHS